MLTAIVVSYNSQESIVSCVRGALDSGANRVIVWDNSSTDAVPTRIRKELKDDRVSVVSGSGNLGFGEANNRALEMVSDEDDVILLNPDCILTGDCVEEMVAAIRAEKVGLVAPRMRYDDGSFGYSGGAKPRLVKELLALTEIDELLPDRLRRMAVDLLTKRRNRPSYSASKVAGAPIEVDWVSGFCIAARAATLKLVGGFDPVFFLYFEDVDISLRVGALGFRNLVVRNVSALHYESTSMTPQRKSDHYRRGMWAYFRKHGNPIERCVATSVAGPLASAAQ